MVSCALCAPLYLNRNVFCFQNQLKRRLHALTIASATCFMFPIAMWDVIIVSSMTFVFHFTSKLRQGYLIMEYLIVLWFWLDWCMTIYVILFVSLVWLLQGSPSESNGKLPFSAWAFSSTILFGNIVIFYADSIAEERYVMIALPCPYVIVTWVKESCFLHFGY